MSTFPTSTPSSLVSSFAAQIAKALEGYYNPLNDAAVASYKQAVANGQSPTLPMLTLVNEDLILQYESQANSGAQPSWAGILFTLPYIPPPVDSNPVTITIGAQIAPGIFQMTLSDNSQLNNGTKFTVNGVNYQSVWTTPFGNEVAQVVH